jgi:ankyrin repeat protein
LFGASIPAYRGSLPVAQLHCNLAFLFLSVMSEALHQALANRDLKQLLAHLQRGEDVNAVDAQGMTLLHKATLLGDLELLDLLLAHGASAHCLWIPQGQPHSIWLPPAARWKWWSGF